MNCKPGDVAYIVSPYVANGRGHVVEVVRAARETEWLEGVCYSLVSPGPGWVCSGRVPNELGDVRTMLAISDVCLRPIRDPGECVKDEMLRPLPHEVTA